MRSRLAPLVPLLALLLGACNSASSGSTTPSADQTVDFGLPYGPVTQPWHVDSTPPDEPVARWEIQADDSAPSPPAVLGLESVNHHSESTFNLCWSTAYTFRNGRLEVAMRARDGKIDQGGGLAWRIRGPRDYYVCRYNPLESNFRLYVVSNGERKQLGSVTVPKRPKPWCRIRVEQDGERIRCTLDGQFTIEATDGTIREVGGVGLWTKADARTRFDDLKVAAR